MPFQRQEAAAEAEAAAHHPNPNQRPEQSQDASAFHDAVLEASAVLVRPLLFAANSQRTA